MQTMFQLLLRSLLLAPWHFYIGDAVALRLYLQMRHRTRVLLVIAFSATRRQASITRYDRKAAMPCSSPIVAVSHRGGLLRVREYVDMRYLFAKKLPSLLPERSNVFGCRLINEPTKS
jgi:hypothetical protein